MAIVKHNSSVSWSPLYSWPKKAPYPYVPRSWAKWHRRGQLQCLSACQRLTGINWRGSHHSQPWCRIPVKPGNRNKIYWQVSPTGGYEQAPTGQLCLSHFLVGKQKWNEQAWQIYSTLVIKKWSPGQTICVRRTPELSLPEEVPISFLFTHLTNVFSNWQYRCQNHWLQWQYI